MTRLLRRIKFYRKKFQVPLIQSEEAARGRAASFVQRMAKS